MKKVNYILIACLALFLTSCFQDTINSFDSLYVQLPIYARKKHIDRKAPSIDVEFKNLHEYSEYKTYEKRIKKAEFVQFTYWIDSMVLANHRVFNPVLDKDLAFEYIRFYIQIAKCIGPNDESLDSNDFVPDPANGKILIAEYIRPKIVDFYKTPKNIIELPDSTARLLDVLLRAKPYYYLTDEYGPVVGQTGVKVNFPYIESRYDLVIRYDITL
jgi:hypothetical protein